MTRALSLLLALVGGLAPWSALAAPELQRTHEQILRALSLPGGRLGKKERLGFRYLSASQGPSAVPAVQRGRRSGIFLPGHAVYSARELTTLAKAAVEQSYSPYADKAVRPVEDGRERARAHAIFWKLGSRLRRELGVPAAESPGPLLLLEGGRAELPGATSLATGAMILHRGSLSLADTVARALLTARSKRELLGNLVSVALGRAPEVEVDRRQGRQLADGFLAVTVGHEMTHGLKQHVAQGRPTDLIPTPFGSSSRTYRAQELASDVGGAELALRGGFSPAGALSFYLYQSVLEAYTGSMNGPLAGTHPRSNERYRVVYRFIEKRAERERLLFDGVHAPRKGPAYLGAADRQSLKGLPTPAELDEFLLSLPQGTRYLYPGAPGR